MRCSVIVEQYAVNCPSAEYVVVVERHEQADNKRDNGDYNTRRGKSLIAGAFEEAEQRREDADRLQHESYSPKTHYRRDESEDSKYVEETERFFLDMGRHRLHGRLGGGRYGLNRCGVAAVRLGKLFSCFEELMLQNEFSFLLSAPQLIHFFIFLSFL